MWLIKIKQSSRSLSSYVTQLWKIQNTAQLLPQCMPVTARQLARLCRGAGTTVLLRSRDLGTKSTFLQDRASAGPLQLCPSVDAEALEWWAGGLLMRQFQLGLQMASYLLGLASWCSSMVHRNLPASPGETNSVWKKLEMDLPRWSKTLMLKTKRHFQAKGSMSSQTQGACKHKSCKSSRLMMDASGTAPHKYPPCPPR